MSPILYSAVPLDRAHERRRDEAALESMRTDPRRLVVPCWHELSLTGAGLIGGSDGARLLDLAGQVIFLGLADQGIPVWAADLSHVAAEPDGSAPRLGLDGSWASLRAVGGTLPAGEAAILAYARALVHWHRRSRFCGSCGSPTQSREGGHLRACLDEHCAALHYPRTDPAVIMRVDGVDAQGDPAILMHRQKAWAAGMWSVLAGFVEPGETLEEAVVREVREEAGITVADVRYGHSQPWPFPSSLMIGFSATATGGVLRPDPDEIEDAQWFSRARIAAEFDDANRISGNGAPFLPRPDAIARRLIDAWLLRGGMG
jgi:NAD+ diphosphatase